MKGEADGSEIESNHLQADHMKQIHVFSVWMWCLLSQSVTEVKNWQDTKGDIYVAYSKTMVVTVRIKNLRTDEDQPASKLESTSS